VHQDGESISQSLLERERWTEKAPLSHGLIGY